MMHITNSTYLNPGFGVYNAPIIGWSNVARYNSFSASSFILGRGEPSNLWNPDTVTGWRALVSTGSVVTVTLDNSGTEAVDYLAFASHNLKQLGCTYSVQRSADGSTWTALVPTTVALDSAPVLAHFDATAQRFFRVVITVVSAGVSNQELVIGNMRVGLALVLQRRISAGHRSSLLSATADTQRLVTDTGQYAGSVTKRRWRTGEIRQQNNTADFARSYVLAFANHLIDVPPVVGQPTGAFYFGWRPADYPAEVCYAWPASELNVTNDNGQFVSWELPYRALF